MLFWPGVSEVNPVYRVSPGETTSTVDPPQKIWGIFGNVNSATTFAMIRDGTSNTIMTGELQRITAIPTSIGGANANYLSHDGWAVGGDATGFTTGVCAVTSVGGPPPTPMLNNLLYSSPGSDHSGGANFGFADGSVTFLATTVDQNIFALLGSMNDGVAATPPP